MSKHKSQDYKLTAVNYHIKNKQKYVNTCKIFNCSERSLKRWISKYRRNKTLKRNNRKPISYKIIKKQVDYGLKLLDKNQQITLPELSKQIKIKYPVFNISSRQLGNVIRDNNKTRKRTKHKHFPKTRYKQSINKKFELNKFYKQINASSIDKIISLDETSIKPAMIMEYSRCNLGERCILKTDDSYIFRTFTLLVAINNNKCIGYKLYEKGGMTKERLVDFIDDCITDKYTNHLIVLDNAGSHNNQFIKDKIIDTGNKYLFSVPYSPETNPIEMFFSQIKHYMKLNKRVLRFCELKKEVENVISKVKKENYKNYFSYAYQKKNNIRHKTKVSTLHRKLKTYKL